MRTVIIEVSGGVVQEVYSNDAVRVIKIDWDAGESPGDAYEVGEFPAQSFAAFPSDTREALGAFLE
jgi:hypothetical protein